MNLSVVALATLAVLAVVAALALPRTPPTGESAAPPLAPAAPSADSVGPSAAPVTQDLAAIPVVVEPPKRIPAKAPKRVAAAPVTKPPAPAVEARRSERSDAGAADVEPSRPAAAAPLPAVEIAGVAPTTITGCLEVRVDDERFRLTDTEGQNTPKSRSWRTGFLKKRPAAVYLVGISDSEALKSDVGKRVAATGVLTSSDLKVSSLRVVSPDCN
jgi:hypothetical protein